MHRESGGEAVPNERGREQRGLASRLSYVQFCSVAAGIICSLIGFTLHGMVAALIGGLLGIVLTELGLRLMLRSRSTSESNPQGDSR